MAGGKSLIRYIKFSRTINPNCSDHRFLQTRRASEVIFGIATSGTQLESEVVVDNGLYQLVTTIFRTIFRKIVGEVHIYHTKRRILLSSVEKVEEIRCQIFSYPLTIIES